MGAPSRAKARKEKAFEMDLTRPSGWLSLETERKCQRHLGCSPWRRDCAVNGGRERVRKSRPGVEVGAGAMGCCRQV